MNFVNGILGLTWLVASTVPCIIHVHALADKDADGNITFTQETRLTGLIAHGLVGFTLLFLDALKLIPRAVLLGIFLFMGLSSIVNIQFYHRILLWFQQPSEWPQTPYTKYMQPSRIHMYKLIELCFFGAVFAIQNIEAAKIGFPFMTFLCIPGRMFLLPRFLEGWELCLLDGEDEEIEEWLDAKIAHPTTNEDKAKHAESDEGSDEESGFRQYSAHAVHMDPGSQLPYTKEEIEK